MSDTEHTLQEIIQFINQAASVEVRGNVSVPIFKIASLEDTIEGSLAWIKPKMPDKTDLLRHKKDVVFVCNKETFEHYKFLASDNCFLIFSNPKYLFSKIVNHFYITPPEAGIHPTAFIHPAAILGKNCSIGPHTYIGKSKIGNNVIIHGNCFIYDKADIGSNVVIHAGTVIGSDGFGYTRHGEEVEKFPHIGGVVIEDDVEIGSNTCIDRGALNNTIIQRGAKIDNLVHIAHNVIISENAFVVAHAMIGGSSEIGKSAWISPSASILQQVRVGENAVVGMGAVVLKNIPADEVWAGVPAKKIKDNND